MRIHHCQLINLPQIPDERGSLSFVEANRHIPFTFNRIYYLYDIPAGSERGGHAHKALYQLMICLNGSFEVTLDDGYEKKTVILSKADEGLLIVPMIWRELKHFSENAVCLVLASDYYDETDYFRNYQEFQKAIRGES